MLRETSQEKALRLAAVRPLEECAEIEARIRKAHLRTGHDPDGRPPRLERLVAHIRKHLFEGTLSVEGACKAVGIGDRAIGGELRAYAGCTVDELIDRLRIDTAYELVVATNIRLGDISHLVGFRAYRTFTRSYSLFVGEPPRETRKRHGGTPFDLPPDEPYNFRDFRSVRRLGEGEATPNELERLRRTLKELYPDTFGEPEPEPEASAVTNLPPYVDTEVFEKLVAEHQIWPVLGDLPFVEQRRYVRQYPCWTPALFDFLHRRSREEGRRDRQRGIELSQLALDSLDGNEDRLGERIHSLRAQGWAWLGNARRLALEFFAADTALRKAEAMLQACEGRPDPFACGIVHICKGTLRMFQRRNREAIESFGCALACFERTSEVAWRIRTLLSHGLAATYSGNFGEAISLLGRAEALLEPDIDGALAFDVHLAMATAFAREDDYEAADEQLGLARQYSVSVVVPDLKYKYLWLEGIINHGRRRAEIAEAKYREGWEGFENADQPLYAAVLMLDLAALYLEAGRETEAVDVLQAACRILTLFDLYEDTIASIRLLKAAVDRLQVSETVLAEVRSAMQRDPLVALPKRTEPGADIPAP